MPAIISFNFRLLWVRNSSRVRFSFSLQILRFCVVMWCLCNLKLPNLIKCWRYSALICNIFFFALQKSIILKIFRWDGRGSRSHGKNTRMEMILFPRFHFFFESIWKYFRTIHYFFAKMCTKVCVRIVYCCESCVEAYFGINNGILIRFRVTFNIVLYNVNVIGCSRNETAFAIRVRIIQFDLLCVKIDWILILTLSSQPSTSVYLVHTKQENRYEIFIYVISFVMLWDNTTIQTIYAT